jgi:SnoaL-like domain
VSSGDDAAGTRTAMVALFLAGDAAGMAELLGAGATFRSPVTEYRGRERVREVLAAVVQVVDDRRLTRLLEAPGATAAAFDATVDGRAGEGVLLIVGTSDGGVSEVTLMVRPLRSLLAGIERMKVLLETA